MIDYRIILINGPKHSGKDTLAETFYHDAHPMAVLGERRIVGFTEKFAEPLKRAIPEFFDMEREVLEEHKDEITLPNYKRYRDAQITLSEIWAKPTFGEGIFGDLLARRLWRAIKSNRGDGWTAIYVISDSGFQREAEELAIHFGSKMATVKLKRPNTAFIPGDDSRGYITGIGPTVWLDNDGTKEELLAKFKAFLRDEVLKENA